MSSSSEWANKLRREATAAVGLLDGIEALYSEMVNNANQYHELKYEAMDPPQVPPSISVGDALKQWLDETNVSSTFPGLTGEDFWQLALALNAMQDGLTADQLKALHWGAN